MKTKILSAVCFTALTLSPAIWGMDMNMSKSMNMEHPNGMDMGQDMKMGHKQHNHSSSSTTVSTVTIHASGTVKSISQDHTMIRIFHDPIPELKWPAMNMEFEVIDHDLTHPLESGDRVKFEFIQKDGKNVIMKMSK
jgi:Cu/Ag efflux protein CusF